MRFRSRRAIVPFWLLLVAAAWAAGYSVAVWRNARIVGERIPDVDIRPERTAPEHSERPASPDVPPVAIPASQDASSPRSRGGACVAIIVDDMGSSMRVARDLAAMPLPLTWAVIPGQPRTESVAAFAREKEIPMLVHMPMEPVGNGYDKNFLIGVNTSDDVIREEVRRVFLLYPWAIGMNNHMGSRATADRNVMRSLMKAMKPTGKIFVDSRTTASSVAVEEAAEAGVPALASSVFLDHEATPEYMERQRERMFRLARKHGRVIAIIHPRPKSLELLRRLAETPSGDVRFVTLPELIHNGNEPMRRLAP
jgi:polysaccharide deacetylase 2 family uncharacterized protein YibQ